MFDDTPKRRPNPFTTLDDFRRSIAQMRDMGSVQDLIGKIPGLGQMAADVDEVAIKAEVRRMQGIIDSMTAVESRNPDLIDVSCHRRIAAGASVEPSDVSSLVKQFHAMVALCEQMSRGEDDRRGSGDGRFGTCRCL